MAEIATVPIPMPDDDDTSRPSDAPEWPKRAWCKKRVWFGRCPIGAECGRNMQCLWKHKKSKDDVCNLMQAHLVADNEGRRHTSVLDSGGDCELQASAIVEANKDDETYIHSELSDVQIWVDENLEEVMAPDWEIERLRKLKEYKDSQGNSWKPNKWSGRSSGGGSSGPYGWTNKGGSSWDGWKGGGSKGDRSWDSSADEGGDWDKSWGGNDSWSDQRSGPRIIDPQSLASYGKGATILGHQSGLPAAMVPLEGGQTATLAPLLPAAYIGLSRAEMGELIDSLQRTHGNLISLAEMCQRNKLAYEAEANGISATINKLNKLLR